MIFKFYIDLLFSVMFRQAIGAATAIGIGVGSSILSSLFSGDKKEDIKKLRDDQKKLYEEAKASANRHFADVVTRFDNNLSAYKDELVARGIATDEQIQSIFSEKNPAIARYVDNLEKGYKESQSKVYNQIKRANVDEIRRWKQQGVTGGTIGRQIAGNQMARLEQAENILTTKFNQVLQPQAQIAQGQMSARERALAQNVGAQTQAGQLGVTVPVQVGAQQGQAQTGLDVANIGAQGQLGAAQAQQATPSPLGTALGEAGKVFTKTGIEKILE